LIGRESNIIVIRGQGRPVYDQMKHAVEEFFPESGILDGNGGVVNAPRTPVSFNQPERPDLQRVDTGISSIVGSDNGDRPGGFVLVIDGTALGYVSALMLCGI
jgi:phospholipid-translocating ATPase